MATAPVDFRKSMNGLTAYVVNNFELDPYEGAFFVFQTKSGDKIKVLQPKTQTMYLRGMRDFTWFLGHAPASATPEELRAFQLDMKERGVGAPTFNNRLTVLSFFFAATCRRPEVKRHTRYQRAAKKIPVVLRAEEVTHIIEATRGPGLQYRAAFSVASGGGLLAGGVTHLKVGDIDSDRMLGPQGSTGYVVAQFAATVA